MDKIECYDKDGLKYVSKKTKEQVQENIEMSFANTRLNSPRHTRFLSLERARSFPSEQSTQLELKSSRQKFNICGEKYDIQEATLRRFPNTLLGDKTRREKYWDEINKEYYLDRNRACFESVLTYYQSNGILVKPHNVPDILFVKEIQFYDLGDDVLQRDKGYNLYYPSNIMSMWLTHRFSLNMSGDM